MCNRNRAWQPRFKRPRPRDNDVIGPKRDDIITHDATAIANTPPSPTELTRAGCCRRLATSRGSASRQSYPLAQAPAWLES